MANDKKRATQLNCEIAEVTASLTACLRLGMSEGIEPRVTSREVFGAFRAPSQAEYERRELAEAQGKLVEVQRALLADRKEAQASFLGAMRKSPELVGERIGWLLDGNYGYGAMLLAKRVLASPRMNRAAALSQMIGAFEWQSPEAMTREAWKKLSAKEKARLDSAVQEAIASALSGEL